MSAVCPAPEFVLAHARSLQAEKLRGDLSGTVCASPPGPKGSTSRISTPLMPGGPGTGSAPVRFPTGSSILPGRSYCSRSPPATSTPSNDLHSRLRTGPGSAEAGQRRRREQGRGSCALSTRRTGSQTARCLMPLVPADCDDDRGHTTGDEECEQCENGHGDDIDGQGQWELPLPILGQGRTSPACYRGTGTAPAPIWNLGLRCSMLIAAQDRRSSQGLTSHLRVQLCAAVNEDSQEWPAQVCSE